MNRARSVENGTSRELTSPVLFFYDGVHRDAVIFPKLAPHGEKVKFPRLACRFADTPAQQHVEFISAPAAEPQKRRYFQRFEKCHHRVRGAHPKLIRLGTGGGLGGDNDRFHFARSNASISPD